MLSRSVNRCFRMNDFDDVTNREEFDSTMARTVFSDRSGGKGCAVLRRLLDGGKATDGITKDQLWILLMKTHSLLPSGTRSRFDSSGSSAADISIGHVDFLKESFESLKSDLLSTIERKVEDKVTAILQKTVPDDEEEKVAVPPMRRYVDIKLDTTVTEDDDSTPVCPKVQWTDHFRPKVEEALKGVPVLNTVVNKGSVRLSFQTEDQLKEAKDILSPVFTQDVQMVTEKKAYLDPRIAINDLGEDLLNKEALFAELAGVKNEGIKTLVDQGETLKVIHINPRGKFAVLKVSPEIRRVIASNKDKVFLRLRQHSVRDRFHVIQCFHCQEYGHVAGSIRCSKKDDSAVCAFCSGRHETRECNNKKRNDVGRMVCVNCNNSGSREDKRYAKTHMASSALCPYYINERGRLMDRTSGVTKEEKNGYRTRAMEDLRTKRLGGSGR